MEHTPPQDELTLDDYEKYAQLYDYYSDFHEEHEAKTAHNDDLIDGEQIMPHTTATIDAAQEHQIQPQKSSHSEKDLLHPRNLKKIARVGYLEQKTTSLLNTWQIRYCYLTHDKLYCYTDEHKYKLQGFVNFRLTKCEVHQESCIIQICFGENQTPLILKAYSEHEANCWFDDIRYLIQSFNTSQKIRFREQKKHIYEDKDGLTEKQFLSCAETGDIVLMKTGDTQSALQRFVTNSEYDHVGILIKFAHNQVKIFEANADDGVNLYDWDQFHTQFHQYEKICFRHLHHEGKEEFQTFLQKFIKQTLGQKYELGVIKLMRKSSDDDVEKAKNGYFCSELVAKIYKLTGLLDKQKASSQYWPIDFTEASEMTLLNGAYLDRQKIIILNKHLKSNY